MTRRNFVFKCEDGRYAVSPEFNGDKEEFEHFRSSDECDITFEHMKEIMSHVFSLQDFILGVKTIEEAYHSCIGKCEWEKIKYYNSFDDIKCNDYIYLVCDGTVTSV